MTACLFLLSCEENDDTRVKLIIESISSSEGFFDDEVVIRGTGFSPIPSENLVTFNGATAQIISATATSITTRVPFPSSSGNITVTTNNEEAPGPVFTITLPPASNIGYTSFEEVPTFIGDVTYFKPGIAVLDNIQLTEPDSDDPYVDFSATGEELGFDTSFVSDDIGDDGSEPIGVLSNANMDDDGDSDFTGRFQDGNQGFLGADIDGTLEIVFDTVELTSEIVGATLEADIFLGDASSGYEEGDLIEVFYQVDGVLGLPLLSYDFNFANANANTWINGSAQIPLDKIKPGNIVVRMRTNSNSETIYLDRVAIKGVPVNP